MSEDDKPMWRCLTDGCSGGPFAGGDAPKAHSHVAQVEGGGTKVCGGVLDELLFDALVNDSHRRNNSWTARTTAQRAARRTRHSW